jgi:DNA-binding CsgD family transcriptional regulator
MERGVFRGNLEEQQCAVFQRVLDGKRSSEIAQILQISTKDVEQTVRRTCRQLGVSNRMDAARAMAEHYKWTKHPRLNEGNRRSRPESESAREHRYTAANDRTTTNTQRNEIFHLQDGGNLGLASPSKTDNLDKKLGLSNFQSSLASSVYSRRILLMVILIVSSTLALSALISAMQGFDTLASSWS